MTKKTGIRIGIVAIIICIMSFCDLSFADSTYNEKIFDIAEIFYFITSLLSWGWVILAKLAGEFLTNKWVYGEVIGLDSLLRKRRVIIRNIANFGLGFYFIYVIFSAVIGKDDIMKKVKSILLRILVAGVGIQASWFFTAAMIDVSTITMVAAGSLPAQVISMSPRVEEDMKNSLSMFVDKNFAVTSGLEYRINPLNGNNNSIIESVGVSLETVESKEKFIDMLLPSAEDVSGPFYYIGFAILNTNILNPNIISPNDKTLEKMLFNTIIQGGTTIIYAIEIGVLCILALMRIVYLWMFIVLSPLAILLRCISKADKKVGDKIGGEKGFLSTLTKQINLRSFFANIFKPAIITLGIGFALIFTTLMSGITNGNGDKSVDTDIGGVHLISKRDKNSADESYETAMHSNVFSYTIRHVGKGILDFIVSVITVIMVYFIIKMAVGLFGGKDFVSEKIKKLQDSVGGAMTSLPVVSFPGYDKNGMEKTRYLNARQIFGTDRGSVIGKGIEVLQRESIAEYNKQQQIINSWFGNDTGYLAGDEIDRITRATTLSDKKNEINKIKTEKGKGMTLNPQTASNDGFWIQEFTKWLDDRVTKRDYSQMKPEWINMIDRWDNLGDEKSLQKLFEKAENVQTYAKYFFDSDDDRYNITTWKQLKNADISKK